MSEREALAKQLEDVGETVSAMYRRVPDSITQAVAELRKTGATCKHQFSRWCPIDEARGDNEDVTSGVCHCHSWEAK